MNSIKIVSKKNVFDGGRFEVKKVELEIKNVKKTHYDVERKPVVCVFPLTNSYEIYLISQYRYFFEKNILECVAGFINENETSLRAAKRELKEEAGLLASHWELIAKTEIAASVVKGKLYLFLAKDLEEVKQDLRDGEVIKVVKMPLEEAVKKVMSGEINFIETVSGILILDRLRREKKI